MHVEFIRNYPSDTNPTYHKGEHLHEDSVILKKIVFDKFAVEIEPARRGTKEWFAQRMEQSAMPRQVHAADNSVSPPTIKVGWAVVTRDGPGGQRYLVQECRPSGETFLYDGPPKNCPASLVLKYQELNGGDVDPAVLQEQKRIAQCERDNARAESKQREDSAFHRIFGK